MAKTGKKCTVILLLALLTLFQITPAFKTPNCDYYVDPFGDSPREGVRNFTYNMYLIVKEAFSLDSMMVLTAFTPIYLSARILDEEVHRGFYDHECHKNKDYPHKYLEWVTDGSMVVPIILFSGLMQFSSDPRVRLTGGIAFSGVVVTQLMNQVIKHLIATQPLRASMRPLNEDFCPHKRVHNGFPSGHTLGCVYIGVLCGLQLGPKWAIPVGATCAVIAGLTIQCNKHYLSQVVAGATVGTIFAISSSKIINAKMAGRFSWAKNVEFGVGIDQKRKSPCLQASYNF
ncbi:phosphatase PAP2 family protein [bacterium]|jgi:membrane-associated phospholipid phosphatase|nr:phosphatase PAP2 family protein [bacterium]MBT5014844.1 phosphatase PAP2 family protein [bacterium]